MGKAYKEVEIFAQRSSKRGQRREISIRIRNSDLSTKLDTDNSMTVH